MKIAHFQKDITPPIGTLVAGYGDQDVSVAQQGRLMLHGVCLDDGCRKALLISYDLLGLDRRFIREIRQRCAQLIGGTEADVMLTCTHTHGGPHTRRGAKPHKLDIPFCESLVEQTVAAAATVQPDSFVETKVYFHSGHADSNINRRYCGPENVCQAVFKRTELISVADGFKDSEVGTLIFVDGQGKPREIIVNFAAHPLASHGPGKGGLTLTPDYPAVVRQFVADSTGADVTFVTGAAGDQFPLPFEVGSYILDEVARPIATTAIHSAVCAPRAPEYFLMEDAKLKTALHSFQGKLREDRKRRPPDAQPEDTEYELELQLMAIGDICLVGVPGELVGELGMEIKWHTPYRRAYICYNSTDYADYLVHGNAMVSGGYESRNTWFDESVGLQLVSETVAAMRKLKREE